MAARSKTGTSITGDEMRRRLDFIGMDSEKREQLAGLRETVADLLPPVLDDFYDHIREWPEIYNMLGGDAHIAHVKERQLQHWDTIAAGRFDHDYIDSVRQIGGAHHQRNLDPKWYIAGYALILSQLVGTVLKGRGPLRRHDQTTQTIDALIRAVFIDMDLAISVYLDEGRREKERILAELTEDFEANVGNVIDALASASNELEATAGSMAHLAEVSSDESLRLQSRRTRRPRTSARLPPPQRRWRTRSPKSRHRSPRRRGPPETQSISRAAPTTRSPAWCSRPTRSAS